MKSREFFIQPSYHSYKIQGLRQSISQIPFLNYLNICSLHICLTVERQIFKNNKFAYKVLIVKSKSISSAGAETGCSGKCFKSSSGSGEDRLDVWSLMTSWVEVLPRDRFQAASVSVQSWQEMHAVDSHMSFRIWFQLDQLVHHLGENMI